jgi:hypothetical protein
MALKTDRSHGASDISFFANAVAERGGVMTLSTAGSGAAMDQAGAVVAYSVDPSGKEPIGVLMGDVVNYDLTRQKVNVYKEETQLGGKVTLWTQCVVNTNMIKTGITPAGGNIAYLSGSGLLTNVNIGSVQTPRVGKFLSTKDEDGYCKVSINVTH